MPHTHEPRATHALPQTHRRQNERQQRVCQDSEVRVLISDDLLEEDKLKVAKLEKGAKVHKDNLKGAKRSEIRKRF